MKQKLQSNIWKIFLFSVTQRRNFLPILSIYFLTLPNTLANQIGLYTGIGWLVGFFLEIPSGYVSDKIGHKNALIIAKLFMLLSTLCFGFGKSIIFFVLGSSFMSAGFAFTSGTSGAFLHNTLIGLKKDKKYSEILGKISAKASLISAITILFLPFLTKISITFPIRIFLISDLIGLVMAISFFTPKIKYTAEDIEGERILSQLKRFKGRGFYTMSIFLAIMGSLVIGLSPYKEPYLQSIGFPIIFIGSIMGFSRVVWFIVGHNLKFLKKIPVKKLLLYEIFFFSISMIIISKLQNPYLIGLIFAIYLGYYFGRRPILNEYALNNFVINKRYKATMLSIKSQIANLFEAVVVFAMGFIMVNSFNLGFLIAGILMLTISLAIYPFLVKSMKKN